MTALLVLTTAPNTDVAKQLAGDLVEHQLAGCVSQVPGVISTYGWEGKTCCDEEVLLLIKTTDTRYPALETYLADNHPYDVPECIGFPASHSSQAYLAWLTTQCPKPS